MAQTSLNSTGVASSGSLVLQTNGSTTAATFDTAQNMGLGVTPSAWSVLAGLQVKNGSLWGAGADSGLSNNGYFNGSGWRYITTSGATLYQTSSNVHTWYSAASGTAGNAISFGDAKMTLDASGNLGLGVTPSAWGSGQIAMDIGLGSSIWNPGTATQTQILNNSYFNNTNFLFKGTGSASRYRMTGAQHEWYSSTASGTAGGTITFTQAMTLTAAGELLVGTTTATGVLTLKGTSQAVHQYTGSANGFSFGQYNSSGDASINNGANAPLLFATNNTERARITSDGDLLVGTTTINPGMGSTTTGINIRGSGSNYIVVSRSGNTPFYINRSTNDGTLVDLNQDGTTEGTISVSGTTVSYNGGHLARYAQTIGAKDETIVKGTVLTNLNEMNIYTDAKGNAVANEQLNKVKVSDVEGDVNVAGVFVNWSHDEQHNVDEINMAMTGDMIIRIAQGTTVQRGDLLMSAGNGTAKAQGDDIVRAKTIAKVTSTHVTCTYADGSYCVPCVLMAC